MDAEQVTESTEAQPEATGDENQAQQYEQRLKSDPSFAAEQVSKFRSENSRLFNETKQFEPLKEVVSTLGGAEKVKDFLYEYSAIMQHPEVQQVVNHYRDKGSLPTAQQATRHEDQTLEEDEYVDPAVKKLLDRLDKQEEELQSLRGQMSTSKTELAKQSLASQMDKIRSKYEPLGQYDNVKKAIMDQVEVWEKTPQGRDALSGANFETWDMIAARAALSDPNSLIKSLNDQRAQNLRQRATEGGPSTLTTGREEDTQEFSNFRDALKHLESTGQF